MPRLSRVACHCHVETTDRHGTQTKLQRRSEPNSLLPEKIEKLQGRIASSATALAIVARLATSRLVSCILADAEFRPHSCMSIFEVLTEEGTFVTSNFADSDPARGQFMQIDFASSD